MLVSIEQGSANPLWRGCGPVITPLAAAEVSQSTRAFLAAARVAPEVFKLLD